VVEVSHGPADGELIGRVTSRCFRLEEPKDFHGAWLSDVDCSEARLVAALRSVALQVGGDAIVERRCTWRQLQSRRRRLDCEARVVRLDEPATGHFVVDEAAANQSRVWSLDDPTGTQAWRMRVAVFPRVHLGTQDPRRADLVVENATLPLARRHIADVRITCTERCSLDAARAAIRVVAGRLGASDVAGIACVRSGDAWECSGSVADTRGDSAQVHVL
jgi:hypothetical protein